MLRSIYPGVITVVAALLLTACNFPSLAAPPQPPAPVATEAATEGPAPAPQPTQPAPPPTAPPQEVVLDGERDLRNGEWDAAAAEFQAVVDNPAATPEQRSEAKLGLAHASLRSGNFEAAQSALDRFLTDFPDDPRTAWAHFLRGDARMGLSDWAGAISDFEQYIALRPDLADSYAYERIADAHIALGQFDQAVAAFEQALAAERYLVGELQLRERVASFHRSLGNVDAAVAQYDAILAVAQNDGYRASIEFFKAQTLFEAGREPEAYEQFLLVFNTYPFRFEAYNSLVALLDGGIAVSSFQRGLVNYNVQNYEPALASFLDYVAQVGLDYPPDVHLYIADSYRQLGNIDASETEYLALINRFNPDDGAAWGQAHLELADLQAAAGNSEGAFETLDTFVEENPDLPQVADAIHQAAGLAQSLSDDARAAGYFAELINRFGDPRGAAGLFDLGLNAYRAANYPAAEGYFGQASAARGAENPLAASYWLAMALQASERTEEAKERFNRIAEQVPYDYYGYRAADQVAGRAPFTPVGSFSLPTDPETGRAEAEQWLATTFGLAEPVSGELPAAIAADPRLQRAQELWELGIVVDARADFEAVRADYSDDPIASYQLALYFRDIGLYRSSILSARTVFRLAGVSPLDGPEFLARLQYPTYFSDLIVDYAQQYNLDPLFVFSLIWQESLYEGFATSSASAQGLMQIWPPTGEDIAARLNWPNYRTSELQRPVVSVAFGTWLLNEESGRFEGDPYAMLAAYNAGPGNTAIWREAAGGNPDLFVELITIREPQLYVTLIYEHYRAYQVLYGSP